MSSDGALEELLLQHRMLIDSYVTSIEENTHIDAMMMDLETHILALKQQEPQFWQLRVVQYINDVARSHSDTLVDPITIENYANVLETIRDRLQKISMGLIANIHQHEYPDHQKSNEIPLFLLRFWQQVIDAMAHVNCQDGSEDLADQETGIEYEAMTFDDLQSMGSITSGPSMEQVPELLALLDSSITTERTDAMARLKQIPVLDIVHSMSLVNEIASALIHVLLDVNLSDSAIQLFYSILIEIEDSNQYAELYLILSELIGSQYCLSHLMIDKKQLWNSTPTQEQQCIFNIFRLLHMMMTRIPQYWIYISTESLTRIFIMTFQLLSCSLPPLPGVHKTHLATVLDLIIAIDPTIAWYRVWMYKAPNRDQLLLCMDEIGFLSTILQSLVRFRPLDLTRQDAITQQVKMTSINGILMMISVVAQFSHGRKLLYEWTKQPADVYENKNQWISVSSSSGFQTLASENDRFYHYQSDWKDTQAKDALGENILHSLIWSVSVVHYFHSSTTLVEELSGLLRLVPVIIPHILQLVFKGLQVINNKEQKPMNEESEIKHAWFPFHRVIHDEEVVRLVLDALVHRWTHLESQTLQRRCCIHLLTVILESLATSSTVFRHINQMVLITSIRQTLFDQQLEQDLYLRIVKALTMMVTFSPVFTNNLCQSNEKESIIEFLAHKFKSPEYQDVLVSLLHAITYTASGLRQLVNLPQGIEVLNHYINYVLDSSDPSRMLHLLTVPSLAHTFAVHPSVQQWVSNIIEVARVDLDFALAIQSRYSECPYALRNVLQPLYTILTPSMATPFVPTMLLTTHCNNVWSLFLRQTLTTSHGMGTCHSTTVTEDLCTLGFSLLLPTTSCLASMMSLYETILETKTKRLDDETQGSISACSFLATKVQSALDQVGGPTERCLNSVPIYAFEPMVFSNHISSRMNIKLASSITFTIDQMRSSIAYSTQHQTSLDMGMLSQATWELVNEVEKTFHKDSSRLELTIALGSLHYDLLQSGQCKWMDSSSTNNTMENEFPTDAERKLMNTYYKDYCNRLGLTASPTTFHILIKRFGKAAIDCFPLTLLMIWSQFTPEQRILECLEYCTTKCQRQIVYLWPSLSGKPSTLVLIHVAEAVEMILEQEFPETLALLHQCHMTVLMITHRWISQCYWNYLDWPNILLILHFNIVYGTESQVYLIIILLEFMQTSLRNLTVHHIDNLSQAFIEILEFSLMDFHFYPWKNLFLRIRSEYHDRVQHILHN